MYQTKGMVYMIKKSLAKLLFLHFFIFSSIVHSEVNHDKNAIYQDNTEVLHFLLDADKKAFKALKESFKKLCNYHKQYVSVETNIKFDNLEDEFNSNILNRSPVFDSEDLVFPVIKYTKLLSHCSEILKFASATNGHIYNASKIPLEGGYCIAAQGPYELTSKNFIALLAENNSNISISHIHQDEFIGTKSINKRLRDLFNAEQSTDSIADKAVIVDYYVDTDANLEYEILRINNKYHLRIYNTDWIDDTPTKLNKLIAIALFVEKYNNSDLFNQPNAPVVVNCNSGIGRAGTFLSVLNIVRSYLHKTEIMEIDDFILQARSHRKSFVFTAEQYGMLKELSQNYTQYIKNVIAQSSTM
jgi:protein tyrosine phosphatase